MRRDERATAEAALRLMARDLAELMQECGAASAVVRAFVDDRGKMMCSARMHARQRGLDAPREIVGIREEVEL